MTEQVIQSQSMEIDIEQHSVPINDLSEQLKTCNVQCSETENITPKKSCVYLKNGKLDFQEPKLRPENHPLLAERIMYFRDFRQKVEATAELHKMPLEIPPAYFDLIASIVQDSEESLYALASRINDLLSPFLRAEKLSHMFEVAIQKAIKQVATPVKYGLSEEVYASIEHTSEKIPWHLHITRWEVENLNFFPPDMQQVVQLRRQQRTEMSDNVSNYIKQLDSAESVALVTTKHRKNHNPDDKFSAKNEEEKRQREEERKQKEEEKKQRDEEKRQREEEKRQREEEKRKKREEEKKLKEEQKRKREDEKKKKEQSQLRLTALFTKAPPAELNVVNAEKVAEPSIPTLFPPFYVKENVTLVDGLTRNWLPSPNSIDDFITSIKSSSTTTDLATFLSELSPEAKQMRGVSSSIDIRTLLLPGSANILNSPNTRMALRMKLLQFTEDVRPAYYGTFTQKSDIITSRTPFALDTSKLDYDVDSEAEWEPEGEGEEIHSGDEDEDDAADIIDPEDSGWLVPEGYLSDNEGVEGEHDESNRPSIRLPNSSKRTMIRKVVLGPFFERETEEDELVKPFSTNFLIDVSNEGFDPFFEESPRKSAAPIITALTSNNNTLAEGTGAPAFTPISLQNNHQKSEFTEEHKNALINVINENSSESIPNIISEAKANFVLKDVSKRQLEAKLKDFAVKEKRGSDTQPGI
ncbi:hypothetical protein G6F36_008310 [Rhizopus arrhizus]|nr:hypothetical protein G6F36_008310 [Rhizopus arrhizus]